MVQPLQILLVEDNPADIDLTLEMLGQSKLCNTVHVTENGEEALAFLRREPPHEGVPRPDLILLDLNMPRMDGRELLAEIKIDEDLMTIPVVVLTSSEAERDVVKSYKLHANCYIQKPVTIDGFIEIVSAIESFWFCVVKLPPTGR